MINPKFEDKDLLPTGNLIDTIEIQDGHKIECTLACATNPTVFVRESDLRRIILRLNIDDTFNSLEKNRLIPMHT